FREQRVEALIADGRCVATVVPDLPQLLYRLRISDRRFTDHQSANHWSSDHEAGIESAHETSAMLAATLAELDRQHIAAIEINDLVSFDDPLAVVAWATAHAQRGVPLRMYLHDFHAACPSWTLIDDRERYCGVPALDVCARCLPQLDVPFLALLPPTDIPRWRAAWLQLMQLASEIIAFSPASVRILLRAFPQLDPARISVQPHAVEYLDATPLQPDLTLPVRVGVVGNISRHKGSQIVWEMAELISARALPIQIVVIGTIEDQVHSDIVRVTGPFRAESLPTLLAEHRVGICLLPSICPETFSYVTAELMQLQMPLAVFDLGAPAERVIDYPSGRVIADTTAQCALETILDMHCSLRRDATPSPVSHDV
ncbi:MAG: glycosyltransferase, partial [Lysobacteraceae bacterium]